MKEAFVAKLEAQLSEWETAIASLKNKADQKLAPVIKRFDGGNAYRVLARRDG